MSYENPAKVKMFKKIKNSPQQNNPTKTYLEITGIIDKSGNLILFEDELNFNNKTKNLP
jgi:hypothetical protein